MKLTELLQTVEQLDNDALQIPEQLAMDLKDKVDSYVGVIDYYKADIKRLTELVAEFKERLDSKKNQYEKFKQYTKDSMLAFGWNKLQGQSRSLTLIKQQEFYTLREPTSEDPFSVATHSVEYKWDKDALKKHGGEVEGICGFREKILLTPK